ncbi:hypothetical protein [Tsukamurella sp. TY48]|uniref:hypothetical protein n=1 Tax=Tsukamurella TaxID=2060 RepID=UPI001C7D8DDF|nr:hypothetical protein [Tsukamurella sp. TY48]
MADGGGTTWRGTVIEFGRALIVLAIILAGGALGYGSWALLFVKADETCGMGVDAGGRFALGLLGLVWMGVCLIVSGVAAVLLVYGSKRARVIGVVVVVALLLGTGLLQWLNVETFESSC